jgi:hypothetical protein
MSQNAVRLQNLRDFTVQIRHAETNQIIGTGVAVTMDGQIVTCDHVVRAAGVPFPQAGGPEEVSVYFPQARGGEVKARRATVAACFPQHQDDVVLLQLAGGPAPLAPEQIAVLGTAEPSMGNPFRSYGYHALGTIPATFAGGTILGCLECPEGDRFHAGLVQLESSQIADGMSGSAVLDTERNLIVGLVSNTWYPDVRTKHRDTAWAVNARVLTFPPINFDLRDEPLPLRDAPQPKTDIAAARAAVTPDLGVAWNNAPPALPEWVGRDDLLAGVTADWADPARRVTGLIGFGGEGKSSLARRWVDTLLANDSPLVIFRAIMVQALSPIGGQPFSPKLVHWFSPMLVHWFSPMLVHSWASRARRNPGWSLRSSSHSGILPIREPTTPNGRTHVWKEENHHGYS